MKICKLCLEQKEFKDFYINKGCKDGYQPRCIECVKKKTREREENLKLTNPNWEEENRKRHREKYHRLNYKEKHKPTYEKKKKAIEDYKGKYPEKYLAKNAALRVSKIIPSNENHHWSYNQEHWLDVIELSKEDHYLLHRYITYDQNSKMYKTKDGKILNSKEEHIRYFRIIKQI